MPRSERLMADLSPFREDPPQRSSHRRSGASRGGSHGRGDGPQERWPSSEAAHRDAEGDHREAETDGNQMRRDQRERDQRETEANYRGHGSRDAEGNHWEAEEDHRGGHVDEMAPGADDGSETRHEGHEDVAAPAEQGGVWDLLSDMALQADEGNDTYAPAVAAEASGDGDLITAQDMDEGANGEWEIGTPERDLQDWLSSLDAGRGKLLQYFDILRQEFAADVSKIGEMRLVTPCGAGILGTIDTYFWELCGVRQMGHRLLFAKGINALGS